MTKEKFIKSTIILIIGGFITKVLGMIIKVINTRLIGLEGISLYMLIYPTFSLFMSLSQFSLPTSISKLVSEDKYNNKNLVFSSIPIIIIFDILLVGIILLSASFISIDLLKDSRCYLPILCISMVLPFEALSNMLRGYFFGKQRMIPHIISNITEDIIRLITIIIGIPIALKSGIESAVNFIILSNIVSELTSIFVLFFFLPKNFKLNKKDIKPNKKNIKNILNISIPTTGSRLIGNIGYFLEPVILTFFLLKNGYPNTYIVNEYGILTGYVMPILLLPSFFTLAISQALIPIVSKAYSDRNITYAKSKIKQSIIFSMIIGIPTTIILFLVPEIPLKLIYNTTKGSLYMKFMAPICLLYYFQTPLSSSLQAMGKANDSLKGTIIGVTSKLIVLAIGSNLGIGLWGLVFATCINIIVVTIYDYMRVKKHLKKSYEAL